MRVISGLLKGRIINGFDIIGTRPTMDRVKESVFGIIQNSLKDSIVLDLFAGSGNLGIEAISNGSKLVYFNDNNRKCINAIKNNLKDFNVINKSVITNFDYMEALRFYQKNQVNFDLVFLDPPYKDLIINKIMDYLINWKLLKNKALIICEVNEIIPFNHEKILLIKERKYGDKMILIYQYKEK